MKWVLSLLVISRTLLGLLSRVALCQLMRQAAVAPPLSAEKRSAVTGNIVGDIRIDFECLEISLIGLDQTNPVVW